MTASLRVLFAVLMLGIMVAAITSDTDAPRPAFGLAHRR